MHFFNDKFAAEFFKEAILPPLKAKDRLKFVQDMAQKHV